MEETIAKKLKPAEMWEQRKSTLKYPPIGLWVSFSLVGEYSMHNMPFKSR